MTDAKSEAADPARTASSSGADDAQQPQRQADGAAATGASTPAVRFSSAVQEFSLSGDADAAAGADADAATPADAEQPEVTPEQLKAFTKSLHGSLLQERRLNTYQFEAFSLPPSRVSRQSMHFGHHPWTTARRVCCAAPPHLVASATSPPAITKYPPARQRQPLIAPP